MLITDVASRLHSIALVFISWSLGIQEKSRADDIDRGFELARRYCGRCHGEGSFQGSAKLSIVDPAALIAEEYIVPGKPDQSYLWQRIANNEMPPDNQPQPSDDEKRLLKLWIEAGGRKPPRAARPFRSELDVLKLLREDLAALQPADRSQTRYFSLTHLHNNTASISDFDLRYYRAALAKAMNSLSWQRDLVQPRKIDDDATLFAINLKDLGWTAQAWDALLGTYPYGLRFDRSTDSDLAEVATAVQHLCGTPLAHIRADWFTVSATRPPLYHQLLQLPKSDVELEAFLQVDVKRNFQRNQLHRAGFSESGVSISNRLLERHAIRDGYYWKSYDFKRSNGTGNLFQFPLGPVFAGHPFAEFAFQQDGGEIIFSLPNGLQAYFLVDGKGNRIDAGPIEVVRDLKETSGTPLVVNGISCMHCHSSGMIDFKDSVRDGLAVFGDVQHKALQIYPTQEEMDGLVKSDRERFMKSLSATVAPWFQGDASNAPDSPAINPAEPIQMVSRFYNADVSLAVAAYELGIESPEKLASAIKANPNLRRLGLAPLQNQRSIDRLVWENQDAVISPMQNAARELDIGSPYVILSTSK